MVDRFSIMTLWVYSVKNILLKYMYCLRMLVCVCVCARMLVCVCVCVCIHSLTTKLLTFHFKTTRVWWCLVSNYSSHLDDQRYDDYRGHR